MDTTEGTPNEPSGSGPAEADAGARSGPDDLGVFAERLEQAEALDGAVRRIERVAQRIPTRSVLPFLQGRWLGHEVHPSLTDLPIGFWTSSMVLDLMGGRRARPAADLFVALGLATAAPTVATGLADWRRLGATRRRVAAVHAASNVGAVALYAASLAARGRHHRLAGVLLGVAGASAATVGGYLGGHLAFAPDQDSAPTR